MAGSIAPVRRLLLVLLALAVGIVAALGVRPIPVYPEARRPPTGPRLDGVLAPNRLLTEAELLGAGRLAGPEDVELDARGRVYSGVEGGAIVRLARNGRIEPFADTGGRPLGLDFDRDGTLWVADAERGLVSVTPDGAVTVRATESAGRSFRFADDVDVASDGKVYFSDASAVLGPAELHLAPFESPPSGRLIELDPQTNATRVLLDGLRFANGVAVALDGESVLVAETFGYRVRRYWLQGPRHGESEIFADNLPGFPDGISSDGRGGYWLALFSPRHDLLDRVVLPSAWLQSAVARIPSFLQPGAKRYGLVVKLDATGRIVRSLHDPTGAHFANVTSVEQWGDVLYLGSIESRAVGRYQLARGDG